MDWGLVIGCYLGIGVIKALYACFHPDPSKRPAGIHDLKGSLSNNDSLLGMFGPLLLIWLPTLLFIVVGVLFWPF